MKGPRGLYTRYGQGIVNFDLFGFILTKAQPIASKFKNGGITKRGSSQRANRCPGQEAEFEKTLRDRGRGVDAADDSGFTGSEIRQFSMCGVTNPSVRCTKWVTLRVGGDAISELEPFPHRIPMLSLANAFEVQNV